jgi:RND family efflux transporter MFP subunit
VAALCLAAAIGCNRHPEEEEATVEVPTITAETAPVARRTIANTLVVRGTVAALPNQDVKVSALVPGRVEAVTVAEGDSVSAGQVIARIDPRPLADEQRRTRAGVAQAEAAVDNAQTEVTRNQQLFTRGIAAGKEVEDAQNSVAQARAGLEQAQAALNTATLAVDRAQVRSPISGRVVKRMISVGEQVDGTAAQPIVEIANLDRVELAVNLPAEQLSHVKPDQAVEVVAAAYPDDAVTGTVIAIAPAIDPATNAALVRVRLANPDHRLTLGMFADARILLEEHANALVVPPAALVKGDDGAAVYVVGPDGVAARTAVTLGIQTRDWVEVLTGLSDGQTLLVTSVFGLGDKVKVARPS